MPHQEPLKVLIVEARFYDDLADALLDGAKAALDAAGALTADREGPAGPWLMGDGSPPARSTRILLDAVGALPTDAG